MTTKTTTSTTKGRRHAAKPAKPVAARPVAAPKPVLKSVEPKPAKPAVVAEKSIAKTPAVPVVDMRSLDIAAVEVPLVETPAIKTPIVETTAVETPVAETPRPEVAAVETPMVETPIVETPQAEVAEFAAKIIEPPAIAAVFAPAKPKEFMMNDAIKEVTEKGQAYMADLNVKAKSAVEKGTKAFEDMNEFSKGNVEALVESSKIAAKGVETLGQGYADYTRKSFEGLTVALKSFASVKSPAEFFKLQSDYVRGQFDSVVAETSKNTEALIKLAGDVAQPISNRVAVAAEKIKVAA